MEYYCHKKEWNNAICSDINRPRDYHTNEVNQTDISITYMWNLKNTNALQNRNILTNTENKPMVTKEEEMGEGGEEGGGQFRSLGSADTLYH